MRARGIIVALLLCLGPIPASAEAPETALRPEARPGTTAAEPAAPAAPDLRPRARPMAEAPAEAPPAPLRPRPRPGTALAEATPPLPPDSSPVAPALPETDSAARLPVAEAPPASAPLVIALDTPGAADPEPPRPPLEGPPQMVMAETLMSEPPPPLVFTDAWDGVDPILRPDSDPAPDGTATFLRPAARPEALPSVEAPVRVALRPRARPAAPADPGPLVAAAPDAAPVFGLEAADAPQFSPLAVAVALRPAARDPRVIEQASNRQPPPAPGGALCGIRGLEGEVIAPIRASGGCGVEEPVRLLSVGGVRLSAPAIMTCPTASALLTWVETSAQPRFNNTLARLDIMGSYDCRPRNNQAGARLSEHGKGKAIDIGGFTLTSGERITVLEDWGSRAWGEVLRALHRDACGIFGTVLGPNANRQHANHFHFDTADERNGAYCR